MKTVVSHLHHVAKCCLKQAVFKLKEKPPLINRSCGGRVVHFLWQSLYHAFHSETLGTPKHTDTHTYSRLSLPPDFQNLSEIKLCMSRTHHRGDIGRFTGRTRILLNPDFPWNPSMNLVASLQRWVATKTILNICTASSNTILCGLIIS